MLTNNYRNTQPQQSTNFHWRQSQTFAKMDNRPRNQLNSHQNHSTEGEQHCGNCGVLYYFDYACRAIVQQCFHCRKTGHCSKVCRSKPQTTTYSNGVFRPSRQFLGGAPESPGSIDTMKIIGDSQNSIVTKTQYVTTRALIDSGATRSCISAKCLHKLHPIPTPFNPDEPQVLFTANKSALRNLGTVELNVCIESLVIPFTFCVLSYLAYSVVFGLDFLTTAQADINCYDKVISFYYGLVTTTLSTNGADETVFLLSQIVEIPPNSQALFTSPLTKILC
jgi:hypothetical protein